MAVEEWRPVFGYEELYEVSDHGRVRSLDRAVNHPKYGVQRRKGLIKRQSTLKNGYLGVALCKAGIEKQKRVHILVAEAFLSPRPEWSNMVNHINNDPADNRVENLEWSNNSHNKRHANARYKHKGRLVSCSELAEIAGIKFDAMFARLRRMPAEQALSVPCRRRNKSTVLPKQ